METKQSIYSKWMVVGNGLATIKQQKVSTSKVANSKVQ